MQRLLRKSFTAAALISPFSHRSLWGFSPSSSELKVSPIFQHKKPTLTFNKEKFETEATARDAITNAAIRKVGLVQDSPKIYGILEKIKPFYRRFLLSLTNPSVSELMERKLYDVLANDVYNIKQRGYSVVLLNKDAEIRLALKEILFILYGHIDRNKEYDERIVKATKHQYGPNALIYMRPRDGHIANAIIKLKLDVYAKMKLDFQDRKGKTLLAKGAREADEVHEICVESVMGSTMHAGNKSEVTKITNALVNLKFGVPVVVDVDNVINGNCHKDSDNI